MTAIYSYCSLGNTLNCNDIIVRSCKDSSTCINICCKYLTVSCSTLCCHCYICYHIVGFCREDFNLVIGSIRDIKIRDHFIRDIL